MNFYRLLFLSICLLFSMRSRLATHFAKQTPDWVKNGVIYEANIRHQTPEGNIKSFIHHLPRIKELGITILWLQPMQPIGELKRKGSLGSPYSIQNYRSINPEFGNKEDMHLLVERAHELGLKVILDWVANHTAWDHHWTQTHRSYYNLNQQGEFQPPYQTDWFDVIDLNYDNQDLRNAMIADMKYWLEEFDIDGFRCDVASMVPVSFWQQAREELQQVKPIFMLAESDQKNLLDSFDAVYGDHLYHQMIAYKPEHSPAAIFDQQIKWDLAHYGQAGYIMPFITNHDKNAWVKDAPHLFGDALQAYTVLTFITPGVPLIFAGQEAELDYQLTFFEKGEIRWQHTTYTDLIIKLTKLKQNNKALDADSDYTSIPVPPSQSKVQIFLREKLEQQVIAIINLGDTPQKVGINYQDILKRKSTLYKDMITEELWDLNHKTRISLKPWSFKILTSF